MQRSDEEWESWWERIGRPELRRLTEEWWQAAAPEALRPPDFHVVVHQLQMLVWADAPERAVAEHLTELAAQLGYVLDEAATARAAEQIMSWGRDALGFVPKRIVTVDATPGGWTVTLEEFEVTGLRLFRHQLDVLLLGPAGETSRIVLEGAFTLTLADGSVHELEPQLPWEAHLPLFQLRDAEVSSVVIRLDCSLHVTFVEGTQLDVPPEPDGEAWEIVGPGRVMVVCPPGGGKPTIWDETTPSYLYTYRPGEGWTPA